MILANGHTVSCSVCPVSDWHQISKHSYFIQTDLIPELHAWIPFKTSSFEIKTQDPTRPSNKPVFATIVYSMSLSCLYLNLSSMPTLCGVLDDVRPPRSHYGHSSRPSWCWMGSTSGLPLLLSQCEGQQPTLFIVRLWHRASHLGEEMRPNMTSCKENIV